MSEEHTPVYIRFRDAPPGERSIAQGYRSENPRLEEGVSCFRGYKTTNGDGEGLYAYSRREDVG